MSTLTLLVLVPTLALFLWSIAYLIRRHGELTEEDHLGEVKFISPASKIIKNVIVKSFLSIEIILTLVTMYILSLTVAYVAAFTYASQVLDMEPQYSILLAKMGTVRTEPIDERVPNHVLILQIFNPVRVDNKTYYALLMRCRGHELARGIPKQLAELCDHVEENSMVMDARSYADYTSVQKALGLDLNATVANLEELVNLELAPGLFAVHSIGVIGGVSLRIEYADMIVVLPLRDEVLLRLFAKGCSIQSIVLGFNEGLSDEDISSLLEMFDYAILRADSKAVVVSRSYIPTPKTILGMSLALAISMLMVYAIGGGFIEKIRSLGNSLFVIGITKDFFISIVMLGTAITFAMALIPMAILCWLGLLNCVAPLNFILSSVGFLIITSHRLRKNIGLPTRLSPTPSYSYVVEGFVPPEELVKCVRGLFEKDDFYQLKEVKVVNEGERHTVRVDLIYRRALLTMLSAEVYIDRVDHGTRYTVAVDVWSMEDLTQRALASIHQMALSKIVGGVISCIEA